MLISEINICLARVKGNFESGAGCVIMVEKDGSIKIDKARRHIEICMKIVDAISVVEGLSAYVCSHPIRREYQQAEEESKRDFWSIRLFRSEEPEDKHIKEPDVIAVDSKNNVVFVFEVKRGIRQNDNDLFSVIEEAEIGSIRMMVNESKSCRVIGPKVSRGERIGGDEILPTFHITDDTKFALVTDMSDLRTPEASHQQLDKCAIKILEFFLTGLKKDFKIIDLEEGLRGYLRDHD